MNDSLINIDPELLANNVNNAFKTMHKSVKHFRQEILRLECEILATLYHEPRGWYKVVKLIG